MSGHGHPTSIDFFISTVLVVSLPLPVSNSTLTVCPLYFWGRPFQLVHCKTLSSFFVSHLVFFHSWSKWITDFCGLHIFSLFPTPPFHPSFCPQCDSLALCSAALPGNTRSYKMVQGQPQWGNGKTAWEGNCDLPIGLADTWYKRYRAEKRKCVFHISTSWPALGHVTPAYGPITQMLYFLSFLSEKDRKMCSQCEVKTLLWPKPVKDVKLWNAAVGALMIFFFFCLFFEYRERRFSLFEGMSQQFKNVNAIKQRGNLGKNCGCHCE